MGCGKGAWDGRAVPGLCSAAGTTCCEPNVPGAFRTLGVRGGRNFRSGANGEDEDGDTDWAVIGGIVATLIICCCGAACVVIVIVFLVRRRNKQSGGSSSDLYGSHSMHQSHMRSSGALRASRNMPGSGAD